MKVTVNGRSQTVCTVDFDPNHNEVVLIDQRRLPHRFQFVRTKSRISIEKYNRYTFQSKTLQKNVLLLTPAKRNKSATPGIALFIL